jgi:hypothetical protein
VRGMKFIPINELIDGMLEARERERDKVREVFAEAWREACRYDSLSDEERKAWLKESRKEMRRILKANPHAFDWWSEACEALRPPPPGEESQEYDRTIDD